MAEPFRGQILTVAFNFAPSGWAKCDGQLVPIDQNPDLFNLIGTTYGGDGKTTFALPDLRGRAPIHQGGGAGLTQRDIGSSGGAEGVTLTGEQLPAHSHELRANPNKATSKSPAGNLDAAGGSYAAAPDKPTSMAGAAIGPTGGGQAHENMPPFLTVNYIIALTGTNPNPG